jgi:hypothetical protein
LLFIIIGINAVFVIVFIIGIKMHQS